MIGGDEAPGQASGPTEQASQPLGARITTAGGPVNVRRLRASAEHAVPLISSGYAVLNGLEMGLEIFPGGLVHLDYRD